MVRTQVSFGESEYRRAQREARRRGISFAELCRIAIEREIGAVPRKKRWMRHAGAIASGDPDASRSVDDVVYGRERP